MTQRCISFLFRQVDWLGIPETWYPFWYLIIWIFNLFWTLSSLPLRKSAYTEQMYFIQTVLPGTNMPWICCFKVVYNPDKNRMFKVWPPVFYALVCLRCAISVTKIAFCQEIKFRINNSIFRPTICLWQV